MPKTKTDAPRKLSLSEQIREGYKHFLAKRGLTDDGARHNRNWSHGRNAIRRKRQVDSLTNGAE